MPNNNNPFMPGASAPTTPMLGAPTNAPMLGAPTNAPMPGAPTNAPMPGAPTSPDSFEVDLTDVQDRFTIPDGVYKVKCIDIEQSVSKGGNPMFVWTFEVSEGNHVGFQSKVFTAITPAAMWKVAETVQALGVGQTGQTVKFKRTDVINKECGAMIETTEYNGQSRSQISKVLSMEEYLKAKEG